MCDFSLKQDCIPVGCVPSAAVAISEEEVCPRRSVCPGGGGLLRRGDVCLRGCLPGGVCLRERVSARPGYLPKRGGVCPRGAVYPGGGVCPRGCLPGGEVSAGGGASTWRCLSGGRGVCLDGVCPEGGVCLGECTLSPCGQKDTCENITFPQLLLRTVMN